jgi:tetratricopeptide (TPR) repeat protein
MGKALAAGILFAAAAFPVGLSGQTACSAAMDLFHQKLWSGAASGFAECEDHDPGKTDALLYRGKSLVNLRQFDEAMVALQNYAKAHPQSDDAVYLLAFVSFREGKAKDSLSLFSQAAKLKPPTANDFTIIALDYVLLNDYSDAAHYLELSLQMNPDDIEARYHLGRVRYQQNQFDLAIAAFREVIKRDAGNVKAHDNLALSLEAENQIEPAISEYQRAIELDRASSFHSAQPYLNLGSLLAKSNRRDDALPLLVRASELAPGEFRSRYELAKAYFDSNRFALARQQAEAAIKINGNDSPSHYLLARIYQRMGNAELAQEQFRITSEIIRNKDAGPQSGMATGETSH